MMATRLCGGVGGGMSSVRGAASLLVAASPFSHLHLHLQLQQQQQQHRNQQQRPHQNQQLQQQRGVHSRRFLKRVLQAPQRRRERYRERMMGMDEGEPTANGTATIAASSSSSATNRLELRYPPSLKPAFVLPNGWAPRAEQASLETMEVRPPFRVDRTAVGNCLPVYTDYKNNRTRVVTVVRRVKGDMDEFVRECKVVCGTDKVELRGSSFHVEGNHIKAVQTWLYGLGF